MSQQDNTGEKIMKNYNDYTVTHLLDSVYSAFKEEAAIVNGITFSHHFYFQYCKESHDDDYINGRACVPFKPCLGNNYYMAVVDGGNILSTDLKYFFFQPSSIDYVRYDAISADELTKYHNVAWED